MTTNKAPKLTASRAAALAYFAAPKGERAGRYPHGSAINWLTEAGLIEQVPDGFHGDRQITEAGRAARAAR